MNNSSPRTLFTLLGVPIKAEPSAGVTPLSLLGLGLGLSGGQHPLQRLRLGLFLTLTYFIIDLIHFGGHILSARYGGAPMDEVRLKAPLPQAVYHNDDVSPDAHRWRAIGGPAANAVAVLFTWLLRPLAAANSATRLLNSCLLWANGSMMIGSLFPFPFIDGGVLLKWSLVDRGQTPEAADRQVRQTNLALAGLLGLVAAGLALGRSFKTALGSLALAGICLGVGLDKIKP